MKGIVLLGDEAVALGAAHSGVSLAYGYPGTPSTEILEYLQRTNLGGGLRAHWCTNEKTAFEAAVGASLMNKRALVTMKHVGLNVAADPFMNSVLANVQGGLVLAVADDPGMHSSQNEQDSRFYADFAKIPCLEPSNQQEAYDMTREAFDLSERFGVPVMVRLVTRLAHSRATVVAGEPRNENITRKFAGKTDYMVLPETSRTSFSKHLALQAALNEASEQSRHNSLSGRLGTREFGVITSGLGRSYYDENLKELGGEPFHLHIGMYPLPLEKIRRLSAAVDRIVCIEEGYPFIERLLRGLLPGGKEIWGKMDGRISPTGELTPDNVRAAVGLPDSKSFYEVPDSLPPRPPQLCPGCPHTDTFAAIKEALAGFPQSLVTSDIGCYALGYLPPHNAIETTLCMGASIPMARGAAEAGMRPAVATIGDGTFMHSGLTGLADVAAKNLAMTVIIMDNKTTAMTGGQEPVITSEQLRHVVLGLGVEEEHVVELVPLPGRRAENVSILLKEFSYDGLSVVIALRECVQTLKKRNLAARANKKREAAVR
jgi:indolepyruvate ferredoxin oxidoreductase alpha subunit